MKKKKFNKCYQIIHPVSAKDYLVLECCICLNEFVGSGKYCSKNCREVGGKKFVDDDFIKFIKNV